MSSVAEPELAGAGTFWPEPEPVQKWTGSATLVMRFETQDYLIKNVIPDNY